MFEFIYFTVGKQTPCIKLDLMFGLNLSSKMCGAVCVCSLYPGAVQTRFLSQEVIMAAPVALNHSITAVTGVGSSPTRGTCEISQVLLAGSVPGVFFFFFFFFSVFSRFRPTY